jgi:hypothetical protein
LRAIQEGKSCLLSTGASDSPVHHRTLSDADLLPYLAKPTVGAWSHWRTGHCPMHTGQSGAPSRPLARPRVSRGSRGRSLARPTVGSPDSPVNFSRTAPIEFPRAASLQEPAWRTGHCPVHHRTVRCTQTALALAETKLSLSNLFSPVFST